jgi:hypothetical protein
MAMPSNESQDEVRTVWYHDPETNQKSLFTKYQVFFICFIIPSIIFWLAGLLLMHPGPPFIWTASDLMVLVLYLLLPFSFFVPARVIGGEFKKYGYYGALASICVNLLAFAIFTKGLYF